jgi:hypothetical protein
MLPFKRDAVKQSSKNRGRNDPRIPEALKYSLTDPILERLSDLLDVAGQTFVVRKYLKYPPGKSRPDYVFLPANEKPHEFNYPPTVQDIQNVFPEYGGGVYQVYATKPQPQYIYSISIDWMEPKEPFKKEREKKEDEEKSKKKDDLEKLLEETDSIDPKLKNKLLTLAFAKRFGIDPAMLLSDVEEHDNPVDKAVADYLRRHPEVLKDVAAKRVKQLLGLEEDEVEKARKWKEFLYESMGPYGFPMFPPQDPFASMLPWIMAMVPWFSQMMGGGFEQQQPQEELVKIRTKSGRVIYMTRKDYEELKRRKAKKAKKEPQKVSETAETKTPAVDIPPQLKQILSREPEEIAALILSNDMARPYVEEICSKDMDLESAIELISSLAPQYKPMIESVVSANREWFERLIDAIKELYRIEKGEEEVEEEVEEVEEEEKGEEEKEEEVEKKEEAKEEISSLDFAI